MKRFSVAAAVLSLALCVTAAQANLLGDPDFEDTSVNETQTNASWTLTANQPDGI